MDCLLRSLIENENSTFSMKSIRNRTLLYLKGTQQEEKNDHTEYEAALVSIRILIETTYCCVSEFINKVFVAR